MIIFKLGIVNTTEYKYERVKGETLDNAISRVLKLHFKDRYVEELDSYFIAVVNGMEIDKEMIPYLKVSEDDTVLIVPDIKGGNFGQIFKQVVIIAVVVAVSILTKGAGAGPLLTGLATAGAAVGTTLIMNALIPPPGMGDNGALGSSPDSFTGSQTYTIERQSNNTKRLGRVSKVYGIHRVFPTVAANPYTTLEAVNGEIVQFYTAIYDFGLGTNILSDIRIGGTSLVGQVDAQGNPEPTFLNAQYRIVDLNKPAVDEGSWDSEMSNEFTLYKGDPETDNLAYALNKNESPSLPAGDYQVVRELSDNVNGAKQEIIIDFTFPRGLIAYNADGSATDRQVNVRVEFAKVGTNDWKSPSDDDYVDYFRTLGNENVRNFTQPGSYFFDTNEQNKFNTKDYFAPYAIKIHPAGIGTIDGHSVGHTEDQNAIIMNPGVPVGAKVWHVPTGHYCGTVTAVFTVSLPNFPGKSADLYFLDKPIGRRIKTWEAKWNFVKDPWTGAQTIYWDLIPVGNAFEWSTTNSNVFEFVGKNTKPYYSSISFIPKDVDHYKVRITRLSSSGGSSLFQDDLTVLKLTSRFDRQPILTNKRHTFLEIKIQATNQLNGALQNLSAVATSVLDVYDEGTQTWSKEPTNSPVWAFVDLLTGEVNQRAIAKSRLDLTSLLEWRDFCEEIPTPPPGNSYIQPRFQCNFVLDYDTTLKQILDQIASSSQASLNIVDGRYGVLVDKLKTTPVQIFTPRNSWGFSSLRSYLDEPDVLRIQYIDPNNGWRVSNTDVFADGKDINNYETVEEMTAFATTNVEQAWRFGRYMQAQAILRQELISINVDFEYLVCNRGDYVQITQDVMKVGGTPARVKSVSGSQIVIDTEVAIDPGESYGYIYRDVNGITTPNTLTVDDDDTFTLDGTIPAVGDLIIIGIVGQEVFDCIVKSITPLNDLSAELVLVEKADGVYEAESTSTHPVYESYLTDQQDNFAAPGAVVDLSIIENTWRVKGGDYEFYMTTEWDIPTTGAVDVYEVYVDTGNGVFELLDVTKNTTYEYIVNTDDLGVEHCFRVLAVAANGDKISLTDALEDCDTPVDKLTPPSDIEGLFINITNQTLTLEWTPIPDPDIKEFLIRYSPNKNSTWESSIPLARVTNDTTTTTVQARTGLYLIKALDLNLNQSINAAKAFTSVPELFDLNIVDETNDFPALPGSKDLVEVLSPGSVILQEAVSGSPSAVEFYPEGYYYYENLLDLGEIYTVRLQSLIEAEGYSPLDLMANWPTLDSVASLANTGYADWDVETQVRFTDSYNVIENWQPMSDVLTMSEGDQDNWGPWVKFTMGDFTGRIFQFRLKLISYQLNSSPRVFDGIIRADMPDRIDSYDNVVSNASADTEVVYTPAFFGPGTTPVIEITQDNMQQGDYFQFVSKSLSKMVINFYDKDGVRVSRQFDAVVKGYGRQYTESIF